jgi:hypothetical protein
VKNSTPKVQLMYGGETDPMFVDCAEAFHIPPFCGCRD